MGNKKTFKSILMAGTIFAGGMLGAGETPQQDNRNFFEKAVHATTEFVDNALHATTETVLLPVRGSSWLLSETGRLAHNGLNFIGEHTGVVGQMITTPVSKSINFTLGLGAQALNSAADITQTAVEYPVSMAGATLDAGATATRDAEEAARVLGKESLILTANATSDVLSAPVDLVNGALTGTQEIARSTVKGVADATAAGVGLIDQEAGENMQDKIDTIDGAVIAGQTADAITRGLVTGLPSATAKMAPLANKDLRGTFVEQVKQMMNNTDISQTQIPQEIEPIVDATQQVVAEPNTSNLKGLLKTLSQSVEQAENTPIEETASVQYNPLSGGRDNTKAIVQASEIYRANKGR